MSIFDFQFFNFSNFRFFNFSILETPEVSIFDFSIFQFFLKEVEISIFNFQFQFSILKIVNLRSLIRQAAGDSGKRSRGGCPPNFVSKRRRSEAAEAKDEVTRI